MKFDDQSAIVIGSGGTPLYYPAGKMKIGICYVNRRPETMMTKAELFAQDVVLSPGFKKPVKKGFRWRLRNLAQRALYRLQFFAA